MNNKKWSVIVNPNAGNGKGKTDLPRIEQLMIIAGLDYSLHFTAYRHHAAEITRTLLSEGAENLICIGGDGTLNELVNGIFTQKVIPTEKIKLALIPVGVGNDWCRTHQIPLDYAKAVDLIKNNNIMLQDVGFVSYASSGVIQTTYFINVAGMGFDAEVADSVNRLKLNHPAAGKWIYLKQLFLCLLKSHPKLIRVTFDNPSGNQVIETKILSMNAGICRFNGGGMQQLPDAIPDDGLFDVTIIRKMSIFKVLMNVPKLFNGRIYSVKEVSAHVARNITVECNEPLLLECDGETGGEAPFNFQILPKSINVITGLKL
jgi:YegS/Rv2252/BmrU family lipid kinase